MANCNACGKRFGSYGAAVQHMDALDHWGDQDDDQDQGNDGAMTVYTNRSSKAQSRYRNSNSNSNRALQYGNNNNNGNNNSSQFPCETCNLAFSSEIQLNNHMFEKNHFGMQCEFPTCNEVHYTQHSLARHIIFSRHHRKSLAVDMVRLHGNETLFGEIEAFFRQENQSHDHRCPLGATTSPFGQQILCTCVVRAIYFNRHYAYLGGGAPPGWEICFKDVERACRVGEGDTDSHLNLCSSVSSTSGFGSRQVGNFGNPTDTCRLCPILQNGLGAHLPNTPAFGYGTPRPNPSSLRSLLLCLVCTGNTLQSQAGPMAVGFWTPDSIRYERAVTIPIGLIMYTTQASLSYDSLSSGFAGLRIG